MARKSRKTSKTENELKKTATLTQQRKELLLKQLTRYPIVETACKQTDIGRSTYYQWKQEDESFAKQANEALASGKLLINDMAESQLIKKIQEGKVIPIIFWLKNHHPDYNEKMLHIHTANNDLDESELVAVARALMNIGMRGQIKDSTKAIIKKAKEQQEKFNEDSFGKDYKSKREFPLEEEDDDL
jgi:hypothetical protein